MSEEPRDLVRVATIGSVDDGKSTLIGRLLFETGSVARDHLAAAAEASRKLGRGELDLSLLLDGLVAEREQAITIDVGYRRFATARREYILADTPGHEQYTRNMVTGCSGASVALLLIDAALGLRRQSKRHAFLASLFGVAHVVVVVNKMDLVGWSEERFTALRRDYEDFCARLELASLSFVPVSALHGDNVVRRGVAMPWYSGPTVLEILESVYSGSDRNLIDLRLPVQLVLRGASSVRGYAGTIASGVLRRGEEVMVMPSGQSSRISAISSAGVEVDYAFASQAVTVMLEDELDVGRGDVLVHPRNRPRVLQRIAVTMVWMGEQPLQVGRTYLLKCGTATTRALVDEVVFRIDPDTLRRTRGTTLAWNEIGRVVVETFRPLVCDEYARNRQTGGLILIDPESCATIAAGVVIERGGVAEPRTVPSRTAAQHITRTAGSVGREQRERLLGQRAATVWLTGLPGSGKSTLAHLLEAELTRAGRLCTVLDGDNLRHGLNRDLGFSPEDRRENIRRAAEVSVLLQDLGAIVICAFVSPYAEDRAMARQIVGDGFVLVHVDASTEACARRDPKGLWAKARAGEIASFTGVSAPFEAPVDPDLRLDTEQHSAAECVALLVDVLRTRGAVS
ncbi:MAG: adenylyl-sulfate kinase [Planctomycetes bacterium]|nr:adenylyl-sulfate kinase [Planctomycetota bacterium]